ncbi:hypothetical protein AAFF_G00241080 [Aldrovandia affinis]|uniref:H15 domain-containing protein n=1 Tax=Aldrovandia affinis TaxID=143900 RepID=A0AAD7SVT9_9TELE|nr:hypothetical protein AAFF_G00241080 [Aldrovandia affinis]
MEEIPQAPVPAKTLKKRAVNTTKKRGPSVTDLIVKVVSDCKERKGVSLPALIKSLQAGGYDVEKNRSRVKFAIIRLVDNGTLRRITGKGVAGSFKLNIKQKDAKKKTTNNSAPKAKRSPAKKSTVAMKSIAKKARVAKKAPAKKSLKAAAKKAPAKKSLKAAKKAPAKKSQKKPAAKSLKAAAKKAPAKKSMNKVATKESKITKANKATTSKKTSPKKVAPMKK